MERAAHQQAFEGHLDAGRYSSASRNCARHRSLDVVTGEERADAVEGRDNWSTLLRG